jgi:peptide chain release factor 1
MSPSIRRKLEALAERKQEVERLLAEPGVVADNKRFRELSREYASLEPIASGLAALAANQNAIDAARQMQSESDPEMRAMANEELATLESEHRRLDQELYRGIGHTADTVYGRFLDGPL